MISPSERLFEAVAAGNVAAAGDFLKDDPSLAASRNEQGVSIIMFALYHKQLEIAEQLIGHKPPVDVFEAAALGDVERLRHVLDGESEGTSAYSADGFTALALACYFGQAATLKMLIEAGADVNAISQNGANLRPLHGAVAGSHTEVVSILLSAGADPNVRQRGGWTPLHGAANHGDTELVSILLNAGVEKSAKSDDGKTAHDMAAAKNHADVLALLKPIHDSHVNPNL